MMSLILSTLGFAIYNFLLLLLAWDESIEVQILKLQSFILVSAKLILLPCKTLLPLIRIFTKDLEKKQSHQQIYAKLTGKAYQSDCYSLSDYSVSVIPELATAISSFYLWFQKDELDLSYVIKEIQVLDQYLLDSFLINAMQSN